MNNLSISHPDRDLIALCARWEANFRKWEAMPEEVTDPVYSSFYDNEVAPLLEQIARTPAISIEGTKAKAAVLLLDNAAAWKWESNRDDPSPTTLLMASICRETRRGSGAILLQGRNFDLGPATGNDPAGGRVTMRSLLIFWFLGAWAALLIGAGVGVGLSEAFRADQKQCEAPARSWRPARTVFAALGAS
jgi:hypothetical protein